MSFDQKKKKAPAKPAGGGEEQEQLEGVPDISDVLDKADAVQKDETKEDFERRLRNVFEKLLKRGQGRGRCDCF